MRNRRDIACMEQRILRYLLLLLTSSGGRQTRAGHTRGRRKTREKREKRKTRVNEYYMHGNGNGMRGWDEDEDEA
ncbi:hypothetical protein F4821DRAFT_92322 [Hypoxylon rubiginosum]|uniref:Uncharacterized protein n=1 Tax=Hypoxylon rubiginosum TaxID=110542 RepID=A0ACC0D6Y2_9PEZI|nr:hypothetical protein F4821DRAFT_92322 [Hypoxylon rubiginosum]